VHVAHPKTKVGNEVRFEIMKYTLLALMLGLSIGIVQVPALADTWFSRYDINNDGYWSYPEYYRAERSWEFRHPRVERLNDLEMHRVFRQYDADQDGLVRRTEIEHYRNW
jgi:hypothetical protein